MDKMTERVRRALLEETIAQKMTDDADLGELMCSYYDDRIGYLSGLSDEELIEYAA